MCSTYVRYVRTYVRTCVRRLPDPGALQGTVTPRRRAQGGDAGCGSYPSLHARRHFSGDSRVMLMQVPVVHVYCTTNMTTLPMVLEYYAIAG
jgi:hypothetical protein